MAPKKQPQSAQNAHCQVPQAPKPARLTPKISQKSSLVEKQRKSLFFPFEPKSFIFCSRPAAFAPSEEESIRNHTQNPDPPGMINMGGFPPEKRSLCKLGCTNLKSFHPKTGPQLPISSSIFFVAQKRCFLAQKRALRWLAVGHGAMVPPVPNPRAANRESPPPNTPPPPSAPSPLLGGTGGPRKQRGEAAGPNVQPLLPRFNSTAPSGGVGGGGGQIPPRRECK